nr:M23 family metallopeptidase [Stakelama marina]
MPPAANTTPRRAETVRVQPAPAPTPTPAPAAVQRVAQTPQRTGFTYQGAMEQGGAVIGTAPSDTRSLTFDGKEIPVADDGRFLIAFDRDHGPSATLVATLGDGTTVRDTLNVAPRQWKISRLNSLPRLSQPTKEFLALRKPELEQIHAARAMRTGADGWREHFIWPVEGRVSSVFGSQRIYKGGEKGAYHSGVDVAVPTGTPLRAPADGVVILAADHPFTLEGNLLMLDHGMGLNSAFLHLSKIDVKVGDHVRKGQVIAETGATGRATGPHVHWSLKWRDARIDPELMTGPMP